MGVLISLGKSRLLSKYEKIWVLYVRTKFDQSDQCGNSYSYERYHWVHLAQLCRRRPARGARRGAESKLQIQGVIQTSLSCSPTMEECKSPEAEALVAAAVRGPNQAASAATRVEAEAYAAVAAVQLGSTLAVPKLWLLCKLSPKVAVPQPLRLLLRLRLPPRHHFCSAPVPLCPRLWG